MDFTEDPMEAREAAERTQDALDRARENEKSLKAQLNRAKIDLDIAVEKAKTLETRRSNLDSCLKEAEKELRYWKAESGRWEQKCREALVDCHKNNMARSSMLLAQETLARVTAEKNDIEGRLIRLEQECQEKVLKSEEYSRVLNNELVNENVQLKERCTDLAEALDKEKSENLRWSQRIKFLDKRIRTSIEVLEGKRVYDE